MFKNIKSYLVTNFVKSTNINFIKFLTFRRGIILIFLLGLSLFLKPDFEEYQNMLEVHEFEEVTGEYHSENILGNFTVPMDWEYIWIPKQLPKGYVVGVPIEMSTKTDTHGNVLTIITMEFSRLISDSSKGDETSSPKFKFILPGSKEDKSVPKRSYNQRYKNMFTESDEDNSIESNPNAPWKTEHFKFTQYKGFPTDLYSNYIDSTVEYKEDIYYFSKMEDQNILYWFQDGYTLCLISDMNKDKLEQLANTMETSISISAYHPPYYKFAAY